MSDDHAQEESEAPESEGAEEESSGGGLVKKLFARKADQAEAKRKAPEQGVAHIPATVLTVEYVDDSEGMDAALRQMAELLDSMQEKVSAMQETQTQLIAAVNQQARDIAKYVESIGRRVDRVYRKVGAGEGSITKSESMPPLEEMEEPVQLEPEGSLAASGGLSPEVADDPEHQNAWRIARVLAADLEAYHEEAVKEGVLYGSFYKLLKEPIEKARATYQQRVSEDLVSNYDYFSKALDELIARKRMELEREGEA